jgi:hypothetical protein
MARVMLVVALVMGMSGGCKKKKDDEGDYSGGGNPTVMGAAQGVRGAVSRDELLEALAQIRLFIDNASSDGNMPSPETTLAALQREAPKFAKLVTDQKVILNRAGSRDEVWAYAQLPQGNYAVAVASGVEQMDQASLNQRLGR